MIRTEKFNLNVNFSFGFTTINMVMCNPFASLCCYMEGQSKNKLHKLKQKTEFCNGRHTHYKHVTALYNSAL